MIKLENTQVVGWEPAIRGMRNPMNSWEKSDSLFFDKGFDLGVVDHDLMMRLASAGPVDAKFRRMIAVYVDITAPLYWWKEFDTYKVGTVANSCSTMHKIAAKEFTLDDFSCEHMYTDNDLDGHAPDHEEQVTIHVLEQIIRSLNYAREAYLEIKNKDIWWQMIQLLPSSYNQRRTVMLNYEVLAGIYPKRKYHKLDEWHVFCDWIKSLPHSDIIVGDKEGVNIRI